jgi:two-component system, sensor histidine kinase YesM
MIKYFNQKFRRSISAKLISIFILITGILFITNISVNTYINRHLKKVDTVYSSNIVSNKLSEKLKEVQSNVYEYLNTKSAASLENYYKSEQDYRSLMDNLNDKITDNDMLMLEKNIKNMSDTYLKLTDETVKEKRGRNVEKYKNSYEETKLLNQYINSFISNLNTEQLKQNSQNYQLLMVSLRKTEALSLVIMVSIVFISLFLLLLILRNMIGPLVQLAHRANEVANGNFDTEFIKPKSKDEVGILAATFNTMLQSIKNYIELIKEDMENEQQLKEQQLIMENLLKDAQLKYLQAQINPHFLFNSLNAAAQLAMIEEAEQTSVYVAKMADFFRYNVKKMEQDATLKEEIESVDNYIYILNVRLTGDILYRKEVSCDVSEIWVPSMILQPIVENAVKHGISDIERAGEIILKVEEYDNYLNIIIKDNGAGMSEEKITKILSGNINSIGKDTYSTGVGLNNVISRLRLYYGQENLLKIHSEGADQGTEVRIIIPKQDNAIRKGADHVPYTYSR